MNSYTLKERKRTHLAAPDSPQGKEKAAKPRVDIQRLWLRKKASDKDKFRLYASLAVLLEAGMDMARALELVDEQKLGKVWNKQIPVVKEKLLSGANLSESLKHTGLFSSFELTSIQIGEETGFLLSILNQLMDFYEQRIKLRRMIINTFSYPVIVLTITTGTVYFMLHFVVPMFASIFLRFNRELPKLTRLVIDLSDFIGHYGGLILLAVFGLIGAHAMAWRNNKYQQTLGMLLLKIPLVGTTIQKIQVARMASALHYLIKSETPLVKSLELTARMIGFYPLKQLLENASIQVMKGISLHDALDQNNIVPQQVLALIKVGEEVNRLSSMFERLAIQTNKEIEHQTQVISKVLEPVLIMLIAGIVGLVLVAMYMPLFDLSGVM